MCNHEWEYRLDSSTHLAILYPSLLPETLVLPSLQLLMLYPSGNNPFFKRIARESVIPMRPVSGKRRKSLDQKSYLLHSLPFSHPTSCQPSGHLMMSRSTQSLCNLDHFGQGSA